MNPLAVLHHLHRVVAEGEGLSREDAARTLRMVEGMDQEISRLASQARVVCDEIRHLVAVDDVLDPDPGPRGYAIARLRALLNEPPRPSRL